MPTETDREMTAADCRHHRQNPDNTQTDRQTQIHTHTDSDTDRYKHTEYTCLCRCTWSGGWCRLVTFTLPFDSHHGSFASNLEQVADLLCAQVNSASYPPTLSGTGN